MTGHSKLPLLLLLLVNACSTTQEQKPEAPSIEELLAQLTEQNGRICVKFRDLGGHTALSDSLVSVSGRREEHYLVTTMHRCHGLESGSSILFSNSWGELCGGGGGSVGTLDYSCPIKKIYQFQSREEAFKVLEIAKARRAAAELFLDQD